MILGNEKPVRRVGSEMCISVILLYLSYRHPFVFPKSYSIFLGWVDPLSLIVLAFMTYTSPGVHSLKHDDFLVTVPLKTVRSHTRFIIMSTVLHQGVRNHDLSSYDDEVVPGSILNMLPHYN